ncbi:MAG: hypothetical protein SGJ23_01960, partial [Alphaproteobacteria bacterium]|nr:hypothetical protein [Alphaproteobacteria bacterium]
PVPPPPAPTIIAPAPTQSTIMAGPLQDMLPTQVAKLRYCRLTPTEKELTVEVLEGERLFDVAGRVFMDSPEGLTHIAKRNASCLDGRQLMLTDGRVLSGSNLIFAGDRLVVPAKPPTPAAGVATTAPVANQPI